MMLAAADAAEGVGGMPAELELALQCERWGSLPNAGGVLNQPMGLLARMSVALNVYNAFKSEHQRGSSTLTEWSRSNPAAWHVVARIEKMRRNQDG
jgi:hypothetical protein